MKTKKINNSFKNSQTNWKYILIVIILFSLAAGGILGCQWWTEEGERIKITKREIKVGPDEITPEERGLEKWKTKDLFSNVEIVARENALDKDKTNIFIKDLETNQENFFVTGFDFTEEAEFRNGHLYIKKDLFSRTRTDKTQLWKYSFPGNEGVILMEVANDRKIFSFRVSPDESYLTVIAPTKESISFPSEKYKEWGMEPELYTFQVLTFIDLSTEQKKEFSIIDNLASEEVFSLMEDTGVGHGLHLWQPRWSLDSKSFWGRIDLRGPYDPGAPYNISLFRIDIESWNIEKFEIPLCAMDTDLNTEREIVLYDCADNGLYLRVRDLRSDQEKDIISYSAEIFHKYFESPLGYRHPILIEGKESRWLKPKWIDNNTVSYIDFESREEVIEKIE